MLIGNLEIKPFLVLPQCFNEIKQAPDNVYCIFLYLENFVFYLYHSHSSGKQIR